MLLLKNGGIYQFDCVGWVSFAIHHATGIGNQSFTIFASPTQYGWNEQNFAKGFFEEVWRDTTGINSLPSDITVFPRRHPCY